MIVVTGAAGHIGNVLVRHLIQKGEKVRVLLLPGESLESLEGLQVARVEGNVLDPSSLESAFSGADCVFHLAGIVRISPGKKDLIYKINVQGTKNVIAAVLKAGVKRLVYTSSVHAFIDIPRGRVVDERTPINPRKVLGSYAKTKATATLEILKAVEDRNLDAVIVHPSGVIGPWDFRISQMGQMILDFMNKGLKAYIDGEYNFVDVRDVADGLITAWHQGRKGENYILSGHLIRISQILKILQNLTDQKAPQFKMPGWLAIAVSPLSNLYYWIRREKPLFTKYSVQVLQSNAHISNAKANHELDFNPRPIEDTLTDSVKWFQENIKPRR